MSSWSNGSESSSESQSVHRSQEKKTTKDPKKRSKVRLKPVNIPKIREKRKKKIIRCIFQLNSHQNAVIMIN